MVLSLVEICLRSIMYGVENGTIRNVYNFVPLQLRQSLMDMVLARGEIDNSVWIQELNCQQFLRGMTTLDTQCGKDDDDEYLRSVADSISENSRMIGVGIEELKLNLYGDCGDDGVTTGDSVLVTISLVGVVRLIAQCPNLRSLSIRIKGCARAFDFDSKSSICCLGLLNRLETTKSWLTVLENVEELSLASNFGPRVLNGAYPIVKFKKLTSLRLTHVTVDGRQWRKLLNFVGGTLTRLNLDDSHVTHVDGLPIPLPQLKDLKIVDDEHFRCTSSLIANLERCPKLEKVFLSLDRYSRQDFRQYFPYDEAHLKALNRIKPYLWVAIRIWKYEANNDEILDDDSKFKLVSIFREKITHLELYVRFWNPRLTKALEHVVEVCQNLTLLDFSVKEIGPDRQNMNSALIRLFGDRERASKLQNLQLSGDIDFGVLTVIFENCTGLDSLSISNNAHFIDAHLIHWVERGANPSKLSLESCDNITDEGLIPILVRCGKRLTKINLSKTTEKITDRTWRVLIDHCQNVENIWSGDFPMNLKKLARSKCFNAFYSLPDFDSDSE